MDMGNDAALALLGEDFFAFTSQDKSEEDAYTRRIKTDSSVGSPNGRSIGYFLMQHKQQLGQKYVSTINVFKCGDSDFPSMLFQIEHGDAPT